MPVVINAEPLPVGRSREVSFDEELELYVCKVFDFGNETHIVGGSLQDLEVKLDAYDAWMAERKTRNAQADH